MTNFIRISSISTSIIKPDMIESLTYSYLQNNIEHLENASALLSTLEWTNQMMKF